MSKLEEMMKANAAAKAKTKSRPMGLIDMVSVAQDANSSTPPNPLVAGVVSAKAILDRPADELRAAGVLQDIDVDLIDPDPEQPRREFPAEAHADLLGTITRVGLIHPITIRPNLEQPGRYLIVCGERRWRAVKALGWRTIEAKVRQMNAADALALQVVENAEGVREGVSPWDEAIAIGRLVEQLGDQRSVIAATGLQKEFLSKRVALANLSAPIAQLRTDGILNDIETAISLERLMKDHPKAAEALIKKAYNARSIPREWVTTAIRLAKGEAKGGVVRAKIPETATRKAQAFSKVLAGRFSGIKMANIKQGAPTDDGGHSLKVTLEISSEAELERLSEALAGH